MQDPWQIKSGGVSSGIIGFRKELRLEVWFRNAPFCDMEQPDDPEVKLSFLHWQIGVMHTLIKLE